MRQVDVLFEDFVARWARNEPTDLDRFLADAGPDAGELARLIDAFLERAPRREPSAESKNAITALAARLENEPPLLTARVAARQRVRDVVDRILAACDLPAQAEGLVQSYYQRLEGGLLDPRGVSDRVWAVLERSVAPAARKLALDGYVPPAPAAPAVAFHRVADADFAAEVTVSGAPAAGVLSEDISSKVTALFTAPIVD